MQTSDDSSRADRNAGYCSNSTASICCEFDEQQIEPGRVEFEHMLSRGSAQVCAAHGGFVLSVCRSRFACSARSLGGFPALIHRLSSGLSHSSATSLIKSGPPHVPARYSQCVRIQYAQYYRRCIAGLYGQYLHGRLQPIIRIL